MSDTRPRRGLGLLIPTRQAVMISAERPPLDECWEMVRLAEENGLDSVWVGDSITARPRLEPLTTLAYYAARTQRVLLGTAVLLPALRQPVALAHALFNLDQLAKGRLVAGVGVGTAAPANVAEAEALGTSMKVRGRRLDESLDVLRALGSGEPVTREGSGYRMNGVTVGPLPYRRGGPAVWVTCGNGGQELPAQVRRVARYGNGLIANRVVADDVRALRERLRPALREQGRELHELELAVYLTVRIDDDRDRAEAAMRRFLDGYYGRPVSEKGSPVGPPEEAVRTIAELWDAGVTHAIVRFAGEDQIPQTERFLGEVLPKLRGLTRGEG
ncbi:MAG: LLM class flavin-dependent oxidoreductase [Chloroflexi bacterium]|nr:LLM class flavin-dependent oxidoreductase [Chloroflexota bacterium]